MRRTEPARPHAQPSAEQIRTTRELLEHEGVASDGPAPATNIDLESTDLTQSSVQPSAGVLHELPDRTDEAGLPQTEDNQRDSGADVLPT